MRDEDERKTYRDGIRRNREREGVRQQRLCVLPEQGYQPGKGYSSFLR